MNVFNSTGTAFLGPQPFAFNRAAMLAGAPATFITTGITGGPWRKFICLPTLTAQTCHLRERRHRLWSFPEEEALESFTSTLTS